MIKYIYILPLRVTTDHSPFVFVYLYFASVYLNFCICVFVFLSQCVSNCPLSTPPCQPSSLSLPFPSAMIALQREKEKRRNLCNILSTCVQFPAVFVFVFVFVFVLGHQCDQVNSDCKVVPSFLTTPFYCTSADVLDLIS